MKTKKYLINDIGFIIKLNNLCRPLDVQTAVLEDLITLLVKAAVCELEYDRQSYIHTFQSHFVDYPIELVEPIMKTAYLIVQWLIRRLIELGLLTVDRRTALSFGGFYGISTDIIILGD